MLPYSPQQRTRARGLRSDITDAERLLWARLRHRQVSGAKFRRQHPVGPFITDFCCLEHALVIELDGGQHAEQVDADQARTQFLQARGYRVLRFWNNEVLANLAGVLERIDEELKSPHPGPLPKGEGGDNPVVRTEE